jgi:hypothetical protein
LELPSICKNDVKHRVAPTDSLCEWQIPHTHSQWAPSGKDGTLRQRKGGSQDSGGLGSGSVSDYPTYRPLSVRFAFFALWNEELQEGLCPSGRLN